MIDSDNRRRRRRCSCLPTLPCHEFQSGVVGGVVDDNDRPPTAITSIRYRDYRGLERTPPRPGNDSILATLSAHFSPRHFPNLSNLLSSLP